MSELTAALFDVRDPAQHEFLHSRQFPWECVGDLTSRLSRSQPSSAGAEVHPTAVIEGNVTIGPGTKVGPFAIIQGPAIIGSNCFVGACLIRQSWIGDGTTVGYCSEVGRSIVLHDCVISHHCVVLDSIIGNRVKLGGSAKTANVRSDCKPVRVRIDLQKFKADLLKLGALVGDDCGIAAGVILMPGSVLGKATIALPGVHLKGWHPPKSRIRLIQSLQVESQRGETAQQQT